MQPKVEPSQSHLSAWTTFYYVVSSSTLTHKCVRRLDSDRVVCCNHDSTTSSTTRIQVIGWSTSPPAS
eukprot:3186384-Rhodomonas_salina.1